MNNAIKMELTGPRGHQQRTGRFTGGFVDDDDHRRDGVDVLLLRLQVALQALVLLEHADGAGQVVRMLVAGQLRDAVLGVRQPLAQLVQLILLQFGQRFVDPEKTKGTVRHPRPLL